LGELRGRSELRLTDQLGAAKDKWSWQSG